MDWSCGSADNRAVPRCRTDCYGTGLEYCALTRRAVAAIRRCCLSLALPRRGRTCPAVSAPHRADDADRRGNVIARCPVRAAGLDYPALLNGIGRHGVGPEGQIARVVSTAGHVSHAEMHGRRRRRVRVGAGREPALPGVRPETGRRQMIVKSASAPAAVTCRPCCSGSGTTGPLSTLHGRRGGRSRPPYRTRKQAARRRFPGCASGCARGSRSCRCRAGSSASKYPGGSAQEPRPWQRAS
jgi:hypothetical protein